VRPTALAIAPFVGAAVGGSRPTHKLTAAISGSVVALVVACLPLVPWAVRNQHALYAPVLVSTNAGYNLLLGTIGDGSYERLEPAFDCPAGASEIALDRCRRERALSRIVRAPIAWLGRGALKLLYTFGHESAPAQLLAAQSSQQARAFAPIALVCSRAFWPPFLALAIVGARRAVRRRARMRLLLLTCPIAGTLALHFVFIGGDRYHMPLAPFLAALAGYGALHVRTRPTRLPG
jgi:4-amino-4-deoxy-L-arabinose transferase-like glycosyltransferase